jgi:hypothetical protein
MTDRPARASGWAEEQPPHPDDVRAVGYGPDELPQVPRRFADLPVHKEESGRRDFWNPNLSAPEPSMVYLVDERYLYVTDKAGRVEHAEGWLGRLPSEENAERRNLYAQRQAGKPDRERSDDGGHLFATSFEGPGEAINLTAQSRSQNQSVKGSNNWHRMEDALLAKRVAGVQVHATIGVRYPDGTTERPSARNVMLRNEGRPPRRSIFRDPKSQRNRET